MNRLAFRYSLPVILLAMSGATYALGLGELRGQPSLGQPLRLEVDILGEGKTSLESSCFRLVPPSTAVEELPWLSKAVLSIRRGSPSVLEIYSDTPLREPITRVAIRLGCGYEIGREFTIFASPAREGAVESVSASAPASLPVAKRSVNERPSSVRQRPVRSRRDVPRQADMPRSYVPPQADMPPPFYVPQADVPPRLMPRPQLKRETPGDMPDRLFVSSGNDVGDTSLRLSTEFPDLWASGATTDAQRDVLRLEFRMLLAMNEQATTQLATAEKLRGMEATLGELQQHATDFSQRVENSGVAANSSVEKPRSASPTVVPVNDNSSGMSEWGFYGIALGAIFGVLGWLGWRRSKEKQQKFSVLDADEASFSEAIVDPRRDGEKEEPGVVDLPVEPAVLNRPMAVDLELDAGMASALKAPSSMHSESLDSVLSVSATTLDEHFEANPVMELADIMLSFGRVKGAAQALQEYIDNNPQEALQPWIRLMDVYRMAGMKAEFEAVSHNLHRNFNVEVQQWDALAEPHSLDQTQEGGAPSGGAPVAPRAECLEDMPRLMNTVCELWESGDVISYLYQLLRDNRGGQRLGFSLPVVEEILFLIELKEVSQRMEREAASQ